MHFIEIYTVAMLEDRHKLADSWRYLRIQLVALTKQQLTKPGYQRIDEHRKKLLLAWSDREEFNWMEVVWAVLDKGKTLAYQIVQMCGKFCCVFTFFSLSQYSWESILKYTSIECSRETNR